VGESHPLLERLHDLRSDRRVGSALLACLAVAAGLAWLRSSAHASASPGAGSGGLATASTVPRRIPSSTTSPEVIVDVVGAVRAAGVVRMPAGARVFEAIAAAGGATGDADVQQLNLAARLADGARIAVPRKGETLPAASGFDGASGTAAPGPVDLNTASPEALDALPGVGPATAAAIVRDRDEHGPFRSVDDLARVRGIGPAKLEQLRDLVSV
jgi:competence protein ComEA